MIFTYEVFCVFFSSRDSVVWVQRCVVRRLVRRCVISRLVAVFVWFLLKVQLQTITDPINDSGINVANPKAWVFWWFRFYHLSVGILPFYAINLGVVSLFSDLPFTFLAILTMLVYLMYSINLNEWISFSFSKNKKEYFLKHENILL